MPGGHDAGVRFSGSLLTLVGVVLATMAAGSAWWSNFPAPVHTANPMNSSLPYRSLSRPLRLIAVAATALIALIAFGASSAAPAGAATKKAAKCDASSGWAAYAGRAPSFVAGGATGLYIWQERGVWRIGATNDRSIPTTFSAVVNFDAPISGKPVGTEGKSDIVDIRPQSVRLRFSNFGGLDGVAIESPCASTISIKGEIDGQAMTPQQLFFGPVTMSPVSMPGIIQRGSVSPNTSLGATTATLTGQPATSVAVAAAVATACPTTPWPVGVSGRPVSRRGPSGIYAWTEKGMLRLAFESEPGAPRQFEGRIVANAPVTARAAAVDRRDVVKATGQQVAFSLRVNAAGDSFDVVSPCATSFSIEGSIDGVPLLPTQIFVGGAATAAGSVPAIVSR